MRRSYSLNPGVFPAVALSLMAFGLVPGSAAGISQSGPSAFTPGVPAAQPAPFPIPWGAYGHAMTTRGAHQHLPSTMPAFFRRAGAQLEYLGPEPDRWRSRDLNEMDDAWEFDHYTDLENVPPGALDARDRFEFIEALFAAGIERPQQTVGFLPWRMLEVYQRLLTGFAAWRNMPAGQEKAFVEARILNDAGILGHYAADASQPHHTTIHFNGWAEGAPNPGGFTMDRGFHSRFESAFVEAHITFEDVEPRLPRAPRVLENPRAAIWEHVKASNDQIERMYGLEKTHGFNPGGVPHPEAKEFVAQRLASGAEMLLSLWWTAWVESEELAAQRRNREPGS